MREIKFRGKDCSDQWVYGDLIHKRHTKESVLIQDYTGLGSDVDIITIGQYTGLKDKNGKEIYEGDIMNDPTSKNVGVVTWNSVLCQFQLSWQNMHVAADIFFMVKCNSFVIGNIYDNPELIKRKEK